MNKTSELDKYNLYTFIGSFSSNIFTTIEGDEYDCCTYRINHREIGDNQLCAISLEWHESVDRWVIPRYIYFKIKRFQQSYIRIDNSS